MTARRLRAIVFGIGLCWLSAYVAVALCRLSFPFELEWIEGLLLDHVHRVLAGQPAYPKPSPDFVATMYTPGYYYVSAAVAWVIGEGFVAPRLVSLVSSLAICALVFHAVRRETSDWYAASVSAFLFAATFRAAGSWFDLARPDSLFLALWLAAAVRLRFATRPRHDLVAGALLSASILTKQTALLLALPLAAHAIATHPRRAARLLVACGVPTAVVCLAFEWTSDGWFSSYVTTPTGLALDRLPWVLAQLLLLVPVAWAGVAWLAWRAARPGIARKRSSGDYTDCAEGVIRGLRGGVHPGTTRYWAVVAAGVLAGSVYMCLQRGTAQNAFMPVFAVLAILSGLALHDALREGERRSDARQARRVYLMVAAQFVLLGYLPWQHVPTAADASGNQRLVEEVRDADGPVLLYERPYLPRILGKPGHAARVAVAILRPPMDWEVGRQIARAICDGRYGAVILSSPDEFADVLAFRYLPAVRILPDAAVPRTVAGSEPNPNLLYRRRPAGDPGPDRRPAACGG